MGSENLARVLCMSSTHSSPQSHLYSRLSYIDFILFWGATIFYLSSYNFFQPALAKGLLIAGFPRRPVCFSQFCHLTWLFPSGLWLCYTSPWTPALTVFSACSVPEVFWSGLWIFPIQGNVSKCTQLWLAALGVHCLLGDQCLTKDTRERFLQQLQEPHCLPSQGWLRYTEW